MTAIAVCCATVLAVTAIAPPLGRAQTASELSRARDLYTAAEAATKQGRFDDATRDYAAAYALSKDPALLFKIGRANERAGKCEVALIYYLRYVREGRPAERFVATTRERIAACGGDPRSVDGAHSEPPGPPAAGPPTGAGRPALSPTEASRPAPPQPPPVERSPGLPAPARSLAPTSSHKVAWVLTGTGVALAALGGVLAYAADSAENDVRDLYAGFAGQPLSYDPQTEKRYNELVDEGHRYQRLSRAAFGLAGAAAVGAAVLFVIGRGSEAVPRIAPVATASTAGVALTF